MCNGKLFKLNLSLICNTKKKREKKLEQAILAARLAKLNNERGKFRLYYKVTFIMKNNYLFF